MKRTSRLVLLGTALGAALTVASIVPATAINLYDHNNYVGLLYSGKSTTNVGSSANDRASSMSGSGHVFEDTGNSGRVAWLPTSNSLGAHSTNLHWGETWSDRISSFIGD